MSTAQASETDPSPDEELAAICRRQFAVFSRAQARGCGVSDSTLTSRVAVGRYRWLLPGVLAEAGAPDSWEARAIAAVLAIGGEVVLARGSAARVLDLDVGRSSPIAVLVRSRTFEGLGSVRVHRTRVLEGDDVTVVGPFPTTTVARTICDLAGDLEPGRLRSLVSRGVRQGMTDATQLRATAARLGRFRGRRALVTLVDELHPLDSDCRSELETRFLRLMTGAGLPPTAMNLPVVAARGRRRVLDAA